MVFCSPVFLFLFLPVILALYFLVRAELRNGLLLFASLFFYLWGEKNYVIILLTSIIGNYLMGLWLDRARGRWSIRIAIFLAVTLNLGLLAAFKYANFLVDILNAFLPGLHLRPIQLSHVHLPLGISFFTFHALSYVLDVYRREVPALRNPANFALYISFFPQSIAGPIVRYNDVASQLAKRVITREGFADGVRRFIVGLAKKMIIANIVADPADAIFQLPNSELTAGLAWLGIVCYTLQIYFDFSGYSDMAIGLAKMFGFQFRENFQYPYIASSITEFWRRWHISLSTWYRDYLYIPLGGNRAGAGRTYINLLIVFILCGLWHGANWTFLAWGLFHGSFLVAERLALGRWLDRTWSPFRHAYALVVVMAGWVLFRATTFAQASAFFGALVGLGQGTGIRFHTGLYWNVPLVAAIVCGIVGSIPWLPYVIAARNRWLAERPRRGLGLVFEPVFSLAPVAVHGLLLLVSGMLLAGGTYNPFIYFRF